VDLQNLIRNALNLTPAERLFLVDAISRSLNEPDEQIDRLWKNEVEKRFEAFKSGKLNAVDYDKIRNK
jgi:putative addiction module component (TIGR02574 family)